MLCNPLGECARSISSQSKPAPAQISALYESARPSQRPICARLAASACLKGFAGVCMERLSGEAESEGAARTVAGAEGIPGHCGRRPSEGAAEPHLAGFQAFVPRSKLVGEPGHT